MATFAAREAKNEFGHLLDVAQREPVTITKKARPVAVIMSVDEYHRLEESQEALWVLLAEKAEAEGLLGVDESEKFLASLKHAEH